MVMSLCVVPASAAGSGVTITITPDKSRVDTATGDAVVTYTIKAKVERPDVESRFLDDHVRPRRRFDAGGENEKG